MLPDDWRRYVAPAAFLLAATIAVVLIRAGLEAGGSRHGTTAAGLARARRSTSSRRPRSRRPRASPAKRFWVVRAGDTFAVISSKTACRSRRIVRLNPNAHSTSLFIGERIRLR